jgi:SNF2 family DNA or RNA helicase
MGATGWPPDRPSPVSARQINLPWPGLGICRPRGLVDCDLHRLFDFINPGSLGSSKEFSSYVKRFTDRPQNNYGSLRDLVRPYILRRLKTDKSIIADLPDKTEVKTFCPLSRKQAALYQQAVEDLARQLETVDGIKRRGMVLAFLMRTSMGVACSV